MLQVHQFRQVSELEEGISQENAKKIIAEIKKIKT